MAEYLVVADQTVIIPRSCSKSSDTSTRKTRPQSSPYLCWRPAPAGPTSVGSGDGHLSSRHAPKAYSSPPDPGALGDRLDRPLDADVRDRRHGAARDRVPDGADAHRRMAAQRPRPPRVHADVAGEGRGLHAGGGGRSDLGTRPGRGRAGASAGAASGARQRPAAVPRVSGPRARPAASQRAISPVRGTAGP